jgi:hypothetical protein
MYRVCVGWGGRVEWGYCGVLGWICGVRGVGVRDGLGVRYLLSSGLWGDSGEVCASSGMGMGKGGCAGGMKQVYSDEVCGVEWV